jgi:hypothetical protein
MIWLINIIVFIIGLFSGLLLFAWFEKELITKLFIFKADVLYTIKTETNRNNTVLLGLFIIRRKNAKFNHKLGRW